MSIGPQPETTSQNPGPQPVEPVRYITLGGRLRTATEVLAEFGDWNAEAYDPFPMMETDPAIIDQQIALGLEVTGGNVFNFVNNIETLMPGDIKRQVIERYSMWEEPFIDPTEDDSMAEFRSDRIKTVTCQEFFADVDSAIELAELDLEEYRRLLADRINPHRGGAGEAQEALVTYLLPMYRQLRMMGYSHTDLRL